MMRQEVLPANIYILIVCLTQLYTVRCQNACVDKSSCKCTFKDGSIVDLSSLGKTNSTPRFKDVVSPDGNIYSYNPCYGFNEGSECTDASVCLYNPGQKQRVLLANPSDGMFQNDPESKKLVLYYLNQDAETLSNLPTNERRYRIFHFELESESLAPKCSGISIQETSLPVTVDLICDEKAQNPVFRANGLRETGLSLSLTSNCACINGCNSGGLKINSSISAGTVLCIIFFSLLVVYLICGMVFMRVHMKASGLQLVPNIGFWKSIPGLVKDGVIFTVGRTFRCSSYQKI